MKTGLILEGGAMRGMFTAGVMDVMMENSISFDGIIGVSAGAVFGCNFKSHQIGRVIRYNMKYCRDPRYCSCRSLIFTGDLYGADFCYHKIPDELDLFDSETFSSSPEEFYVVATDVESGEPLYHRCTDCGDNDLLWMRASASMPLVSRIVKTDGHKMLDGGIADSIPLRYFESIGYSRNIVVLTQPWDYVKEKNEMLPLMRVIFHRYPRLLETMAHRHENYNETRAYIREQQQRGKVLVICPDEKLPLSRTERDPEKLHAVYEIGRSIALREIGKIRAFAAAEKN